MTTSTNMQQAMAKAAANAKAPNAAQVHDQAAASARKQAPAPAQPAQPDLNAILAQMQAMQAQLLALTQENQALKAAPAKAAKAEKAPTIAAKNLTYTHDAKKNTLTVVIDLAGDILDPDTNSPKVSKSGNTTGVAMLSGSFVGADGRKVGVSLNAYRKI